MASTYSSKTNYLMILLSKGDINGSWGGTYGVRPVVSLVSGTSLEKNEETGVWEIPVINN